jgi:hypothetical protein
LLSNSLKNEVDDLEKKIVHTVAVKLQKDVTKLQNDIQAELGKHKEYIMKKFKDIEKKYSALEERMHIVENQMTLSYGKLIVASHHGSSLNNP